MLPVQTPGTLALELRGNAHGHAVKPACEGARLTNRCRFAGKDQERRLEGVFRVVRATQRRRQTPSTTGP